MDLRDPIWQGISAILAIIGVIVTIATYVLPDFKAGLKKWLKAIFDSPGCMTVIIIGCLAFICLPLVPKTVNGVFSLLITSTPTPTQTFTPTPIPTSSPSPTPSYTYLIYDDFDSGPMPAWNPVSGTWQMVNNQYTITDVTSETDWASGRSFIGDPAWTNYEVGADIHLVNIEPRINIARIMVRAQDVNNYLLLEIRDFDVLDSNWSRGTWYVVQNDQAIEKPAAGFSSFLTTDFSINIQVNQGIITTFIDGVQVSRWGDAPYLSGMVGVGVASRYPTAPTSFDNFYVRTQP